MARALAFDFQASAVLWRPATPTRGATRVSLGRVLSGTLKVNRSWMPYIQASVTLGMDEVAPGPGVPLRQLIPELEPVDTTNRSRVVVPRIDLEIMRTTGPAARLADSVGTDLAARSGSALFSRTNAAAASARLPVNYTAPLRLTIAYLVVTGCRVDYDAGTVELDLATEDLYLDDDVILDKAEGGSAWAVNGNGAPSIATFVTTVLTGRGFTRVMTHKDTAPALLEPVEITFPVESRTREGLDALLVPAGWTPYVDERGEWHLRDLEQAAPTTIPLTHPDERPQRVITDASRAGDWAHAVRHHIRKPNIDTSIDITQTTVLSRAPGRKVRVVTTSLPYSQAAAPEWENVSGAPPGDMVARIRSRMRLASFDLPWRPEWITGIGGTVGVDRHGAELIPNPTFAQNALGWTTSGTVATTPDSTAKLTVTPAIPTSTLQTAAPVFSWAVDRLGLLEPLTFEFDLTRDAYATVTGKVRVDLVMFTETGAVGLILLSWNRDITDAAFAGGATVHFTHTIGNYIGNYPHRARMGVRVRVEWATGATGIARFAIRDLSLRRADETVRVGGMLAASTTDLASGITTLETET